ncbi:hypothetical protein KJ885_05855, partial [Patescibacteria group bacterium]|nr:hypothetical protein [Patescibacteria group bacterium]
RFDSCVASNAGCRPYSVSKNSGVWSGLIGDEIFFNKDVEKCESKNAGCTELYSKDNGLAYNLIRDSSFEALVKGGTNDKDWTEIGGATNFDATGANAFDGSGAINPEESAAGYQTSYLIKMERNTAYAISIYAKHQNLADSGKAQVGVSLYTDPLGASTSHFDANNLVSTCNLVDANGDLFQSENPGSDYDRIFCAFLTPGITLYARVIVRPTDDEPFWFDAVQLEEGVQASSFLSQGYGTVDSVYMKTPPSYLGCDAENPESECSNYVNTCKETEVGCELYSPKDNSPAISGIATINDVCPKECAGYEAFRQKDTYFEKATTTFSYLIPSTARACTANDVGCDEFTNIETETKEYFSFLRQCIKPGEAEDATFYTWEGSDTVGYQLRSHKLKTGEPFVGEEAPVPEYIPGTDASVCDKTIFQAKIGDANYNPDCREFYNADGKVSYRLLSKTIISTDECAQYRKTESDEMNCENSGGQWNPQGEYCIYKGYKEESITCASSASGCRAYTGTSASNMRIVLQDDFESGSVSYWKGGTISSEALSAGGHSLKSLAVGGAATIIKEVDKLLGANSTYTLSFWVKAPAGGTLEARISNAVTGAETFSPAGDWKYFEMGQIQTGGSVAGTELRFSLSGGTGFYIDNIILKEVSQNLYLIKNSWTTPASCDQTLGGLYLPQAMLGCREYADSNKNTLYLKSFSSLCRDSAVGCKSFQNTYNSASDKNEIHNVICALPDKVITASEPCQYNGQTVCNVGQNNSICRFNITDNGVNLTPFSQSGYKDFDAFQDAVAAFTKSKNLISLVARDESTVEVPADKTVYLVEDKNKYCKNVDLGCAAMGQSELYKNARDASTVYYKNLPDNYSKLLCTTEAEGCESWTSTKGVDYFKVPEALCEYKEAGVTATGGWVKKGTTEACYSGFVKDSAYGIWRNADTGYDGSVGMCPASQSGCTELIDPLDTSSANPKGEPYYVIDNAKFQALENSQDCNGKVSLTEGCVLFNKTSDTALKWHALATYFKADQEEGLVAPVDQLAFCGIFPEIFGISIDPFKACTVNADCPAALTQVFPGVIAPVYTGLCEKLPKNANTILKVTRDRECGEWLACKSSYTAYDPITKKKKTVCAELGLCNEYRSVDGDASICANFIANNPDSGEVLNANNYSTRDISWLGMDYSGFSLGNQYPITDVLVGKFEDLTIKAYEDCKKTNGVWDTKTDSCTHFRLYASVNGINYNLDGTFFDRNQAEKAICRGYPEPDAPFPNSLGQYDLNGNLQSVESGFQNANLCDYGENCECDYTKLTYGNISNVEYTAYGNRSVASGICQGGSRDGLPCKPGVAYDENPGLACGKSTEGGTCLMLKRQDDVIGWQGYCLERDDTTPINGDKSQKACMTWLPQDIVPGGRDIYNQFASAGYVPPFGGGKYMCLMSEGNYNVFSDNPTTKYDYPLFFNKINWKQRDSGGNIINGQTDDTVPQEIKTWEDVIKATYLAGGDSGVPVGLSESYYEGLPLAAGYTPLYILGTPFYEHEIDLVKIKVISSSKDAGNYPVGAVFYIRPDQKTTNYMVGNSCDETTTNNCGGEAEGATTLSGGQRAKSIVEENVWYFRYDDGEQSGGAKRDYLNVDVFTMNDSDWSAYCANSDEEKQNSFHLKFTFDSKGKMNYAAVRNCDSNASAGARDFVTLSVVVRKREVCEKVVDIAAFKNQAYTNRLWAYNPVNIKPITSKPYGLPYHLDYEMQPFGTASSDFEPKDAAWYPYYTSGNPTFAGVPWGSDGAYSVTTVIKQSTGGTQTVSGPPQGITSQGGWQSGTPKESDNKLETIDFDPNTGFVASITMAKQYISNLFNKIYKVFKLDRIDLSKDAYSTIVNCEKSPDSDCQLDVASSIEDRYKYPQIFSFDPNSKLSNGQYELAEENRFLIDNKSSDINISGNQYLAAMRFYFWADTDHMPIKSIKVDWEGDGTYDLITTEGFYENHKPLCAKSNSEGATVCSKNVNTVCSSEAICPSVKSVKITQTYAIPSCNDPKTFIPELCGSPTITTSIVTESQTCNSAKTVTFGNSPDACDEAYFELQHIYTCASGSSCVYKPKVIIVDNWETDNTPDSEFMDSTLKGKFGPATGPTITLTAQ